MNIRISAVVIAALAGLVAVVGIYGVAAAEPLVVGASPSLRPALTEILPMFEREYLASVKIVYAGSKTLLHQIEKKAPIDVFMSAGVEEVESLHKKGMTLNGRPRIYAQTSLVLVMASDSTAMSMSLQDALSNATTRIALADAQTSSLGEVTARALAKLYPTYKSHPHILYGSQSENIMSLIRTGEADVGLVFRVDMVNNGYVRTSDESPIGTPGTVQFAQTVPSTCRAPLRSVAENFSDFLMTSRIQRLLVKYGFDPVPLSMGLTPSERKERVS